MGWDGRKTARVQPRCSATRRAPRSTRPTPLHANSQSEMPVIALTIAAAPLLNFLGAPMDLGETAMLYLASLSLRACRKAASSSDLS